MRFNPSADTEAIALTLARPPIIIPLPLIALVFEKKRYELNFFVATNRDNFVSIDSIIYSISTFEGSNIASGAGKSGDNFSKVQREDGIYFRSEITTSKIKILKNNIFADLDITYTLYLTDQRGKSITWTRKSILSLYNFKRGWFSFYNG